MRARGIWAISVSSFQIWCESKTALKNKVLKKEAKRPDKNMTRNQEKQWLQFHRGFKQWSFITQQFKKATLSNSTSFRRKQENGAEKHNQKYKRYKSSQINERYQSIHPGRSVTHKRYKEYSRHITVKLLKPKSSQWSEKKNYLQKSNSKS